MKLKKRYKKHKNIEMPSSKTIIFLVLITTIIAVTFSISKYESILASKDTAKVAKWNISLDTGEKDYILFENNQANEKELTLTIKSESEVSSKYDLELEGLYKNYNIKLRNDSSNYSVDYSFNNDVLNIKNGNDEISFNLNNNDETINVNGNDYYMGKYTVAGTTHISIENKTSNKIVLKFTINSENKVKVIFGNCMEFVRPGKHEDIYKLNISTEAMDMPSECDIKVYALFEQID